MGNEQKLDAVDSNFYRRQSESIDAKVYEKKYPEFKARRLIAKQEGVDPDADAYLYRMTDTLGQPKFIANAADDLPRSESVGSEYSQIIKPFGMSFGHTLKDIRRASKAGRDLESEKALGIKRAFEQFVDRLLSLGDADHGIKGLLTLPSGTTTYTPSIKSISGDTEWGTLASPAGTGEEFALDVIGLASAGVVATKGVFAKFKVVLPLEQYNMLNTLRVGTETGTTALQMALQNEYIESIESWIRCDGAAGSSVDRMCAFPTDAEVVAALIPEELTMHEAQLKNLEYVRNVTASCGGVVARYPVAIVYGDAI